MALDQVEVMRHLGFERFAVVGHDRGGRAAHRLALDHPHALTRLVILDIVPTQSPYQNINQDFATIFYHWFLMVQPESFSETLVQNNAEYSLKCTLLRLGGSKISCANALEDHELEAIARATGRGEVAGVVPPFGEGNRLPSWIGADIFAEYLRTFQMPETIHAICEDYRAAASIELEHDAADLDKKIGCPLLVLWSEKGPFRRTYDVLQTWQDRAIEAHGK